MAGIVEGESREKHGMERQPAEQKYMQIWPKKRQWEIENKKVVNGPASSYNPKKPC